MTLEIYLVKQIKISLFVILKHDRAAGAGIFARYQMVFSPEDPRSGGPVVPQDDKKVMLLKE